MSIALLAVIAVALVIIVLGDYQAHIFSERLLKKFHYKRNRFGVMRNLWDMEFKRNSCESAREAERMLFDKLSEQIAAFQVRIEKLKERNQSGDQEEIKNCEMKIQELLDARNMHQKQMDELDGQKTQLGRNIDDLRSIVGLVNEKIKKT